MTHDALAYLIRESQRLRRAAFVNGVLFGLIVGCLGTVLFLEYGR